MTPANDRGTEGTDTTRSIVRCAVVGAAVLAGAFSGAGLAQSPSTSRFKLEPIDDTGTIPYFIAKGVERSAYRAGDSELAVWALQEWERSAGGPLRLVPAADEDSSLISFHWLPWAADAELGRMEPSNKGGRSIAAVVIRPDEERFRPTIKRRVREDPLMRDVVVYYVCLHEIGHALGLSHSSDPRDVMWSGGSGVTLPIYERYRHRLMSREDIPRTFWLSADDTRRLRDVWRR